jgi:hypothetical protein
MKRKNKNYKRNDFEINHSNSFHSRKMRMIRSVSKVVLAISAGFVLYGLILSIIGAI